MLAANRGTMTNILWKTALRYRELARNISDENARKEILRLAAEYEDRAALLFPPPLVAEPSG
jgi:hypothetical protein